jgi:hypothetical protein
MATYRIDGRVVSQYEYNQKQQSYRDERTKAARLGIGIEMIGMYGGIQQAIDAQSRLARERDARATERFMTEQRLIAQGEAYKAYGFSSQAELNYWANKTPEAPTKQYQWVNNDGSLLNPALAGGPAGCRGLYSDAKLVPTGQLLSSENNSKILTAQIAQSQINGSIGNLTPYVGIGTTTISTTSNVLAPRLAQSTQLSPTTFVNSKSGSNFSLIKISDAVEGGKASFRIQRTGDITVAGSVNFATRNGTALAGADYTVVNETISFAAGESSKIIEVATTADGLAENQDSFHGIIITTRQGDSVSMNAASASIYSQQYSLAKLADAVEGGNATFRVSRTGDTSVSSTVLFSTANGSAIGGLDFTPVNQQINFAAGETTKDINVLALRDSIAESSESFTASLSRVDNDSIISGGSIAATITNGAGTSSYSLAKLSDAVEGGKASFRIQRTGDITVAGSVNFATRNGTALAGADYTAVNETISFAAGESSSSVDVQTLSDSSSELTETFAGAISIISPGDTLANGLASASIIESVVSPSSFL